MFKKRGDVSKQGCALGVLLLVFAGVGWTSAGAQTVDKDPASAKPAEEGSKLPAVNKSRYFNSSEPGCDSTDPNILFADDFEDGNWVVTDGDTAGGKTNPANKGWCGTIFYKRSPSRKGNPKDSFGRVGGAAGTKFAAGSGPHEGIGSAMMADHDFVNQQSVNEFYFRYYLKPLPGYVYGAQKMFTINKGFAGVGGIYFGGVGSVPTKEGYANLAIVPSYDAKFYGDAPATFRTKVWRHQNQGDDILIRPGNWYCIEYHAKLNTPGMKNGIWEMWIDNVGPDGLGNPGPGTLRSRHTDVQWVAPDDNSLIGSLWLENWANPPSTGEEYYDQIVASKARIGPMKKTAAADLPGDYFRLMEAELKALETDTSNPGCMLSAATLYTKQHPSNPSFGDRAKRDLALKLGDRVASQSEKDTSENKQDYEWEIHFWLDTYRLLETELGPERRARWRKEIEKIVGWFVEQVAARIDFPRYQVPFLRTSTNHYAIWSSILHLAGRVLAKKEWEELGSRALHRLSTVEQTVDGYWGESTDNGPTTGYDYLTMTCVALYWEHSRDTAALEALRRSTDFHKHFTWPDGTPVETINGRNRHWGVSAWGHFGFSHWPDGRRYAEFLAGFFAGRKLGSRELGRIAQAALYYHEGPTAPIPQELPRFAYRMKVQAGIRKSQPWTVCLSGLMDLPEDSQYTLDRQGHLSIYHEKLGLILTGANSKYQPELATFLTRSKGQVSHLPISTCLRMSDERDRLGLAYVTFFAELEIPSPTEERIPFRFAFSETGRGRLEETQLNLQLCLKSGQDLETAKTKITLGANRIELGPEQIGGWIRHRGWTLKVDPSARLVWPVFPFNPSRNGPETELVHAVGALTVPLDAQLPQGSVLPWRRQEIAFSLEVPK